MNFESEESGIKIKKNEVEEIFDFDDFFPELDADFNNFVTKDQGVLKDVQNKILVHSVKVTESKVSFLKTLTESHKISGMQHKRSNKL